MSGDAGTEGHAQRLSEQFEAFSGARGQISYAPGRVNLIGDHTDYTGGFVLPASLAIGTWVVAAPRDDATLRIYSTNQDETVLVPLDTNPNQARHHWSDYVAGCAWALIQAGAPLRGADLHISSDLPMGAGLSSSAALEVAVSYALLRVAGLQMSPLQIAQHCRTAENEYVGARCGIMDQFVSAHGQADRALLLDCDSLNWRLVPLPATHCWIIANTLAHHTHAGGEYNTRRAECEELTMLMSRMIPGCKRLADLTDAETERLGRHLPPHLVARLRHVVTENRRVLAAVAALESADLETLGKLLYASHDSLRNDYRVSCNELDVMVELARRLSGVLGSRMMGGGFGGSTISLVEATHAPAVVEQLAAGYAAATGRQPVIQICKFGNAGGNRS